MQKVKQDKRITIILIKAEFELVSKSTKSKTKAHERIIKLRINVGTTRAFSYFRYKLLRMKFSTPEFSSFARLRYAFFLMIFIWLLGTLGYMIIENAAFLDATFMTVITISTVGYGDMLDLSRVGRVFTIFLIIISWVTFAYSISVITTHFVEGEIGQLFNNFRHKKQYKKMKNHVIVVGFGRNGKKVCEELLLDKKPFIIIENSIDIIKVNSSDSFIFMQGDATEDQILLDAGIENANSLISTMPNDADNLYVAISARALNTNLTIVSRAASESAEKKLFKAGVNKVVMPEHVGGSHMASLVSKPDLVDFLKRIDVRGDGDTNLVEIVCSKLPEELKNHSINDLGIRNKSGANIIGFKTPDGDFVINPHPDTKMIPNAKLFVLGTHQQIQILKDILKFD